MAKNSQLSKAFHQFVKATQYTKKGQRNKKVVMKQISGRKP